MTLNLRGRGLFVFSDPGGAKPLLALAQSLENSLDFCKIISDRIYPFFKDFNLVVSESALPAKIELQTAQPDFLFVGTSYTSDIELSYVKEANRLGITSFAFVDHWTSLKERFILNGELIYPTVILVVDIIAKNKALEAGIPEDIIEIFPNPYHNYIRNWEPVYTKNDFFLRLGLIIKEKKIITYAPDPLSNINGELEYGFDEISSTLTLSESIKSLNENYLFLLKLHPNQKNNKIQKSISSQIFILPNDVDTNSLIYYSDVIIGFFSNFLIEADLMHTPVLRYLIEGVKKDPFQDMNIGKIVNQNTLVQEIKLICL